MTAGGNGDDLPEPEIETIRNLVGGQTWNAIADHGAVVTFDGAGVHDNSVDVATLTRVLSHFNGLVRIAQAYRGGLEVKRKGPVTEVKGAGHLAALAPLPGSYAIPLRLDPRPGEMFATDHQELEEVIALILAGGADLDGMLEKLPEADGRRARRAAHRNRDGQRRHRDRRAPRRAHQRRRQSGRRNRHATVRTRSGRSARATSAARFCTGRCGASIPSTTPSRSMPPAKMRTQRRWSQQPLRISS